MSKPSDPIQPGEDMISGADIAARIAYLEFLDEEPDSEEERQERLDLWEDEIGELKMLRELAAEVENYQALSHNPALVAEHYFAQYAQEYADEIYNLDGTGAGAYFSYDAFASDYKSSFTEFEFGHCTYYLQTG